MICFSVAVTKLSDTDGYCAFATTFLKAASQTEPVILHADRQNDGALKAIACRDDQARIALCILGNAIFPRCTDVRFVSRIGQRRPPLVIRARVPTLTGRGKNSIL